MTKQNSLYAAQVEEGARMTDSTSPRVYTAQAGTLALIHSSNPTTKKTTIEYLCDAGEQSAPRPSAHQLLLVETSLLTILRD